jgi:membrane protease subunit HflK
MPIDDLKSDNFPADNPPKNPWGGSVPDGKIENFPPRKKPSAVPDDPIQEFLEKLRDGFFSKKGREYYGGEGGRPPAILNPRLWGIGLILILILWGFTGIYFVNPAENAVITRLGAWDRTQTEPGMGYHLPYPFEQVSLINVLQDRRLSIGFNESAIQSVRGEQGKQDVPQESLMLTADANIVDLDVVLFWNINLAQNYIFKIRDPEDTIKKVAESAIREVVGQTLLQPIITQGRDEVARKVKQIVQTTLDRYESGVEIKEVLIQDATVHPDVIPAFDDVVAALQDAETAQNEAAIYRNDVINKAKGQSREIILAAEGYRDSVVERANGDAKRFNSVLNAYKTGQDVTKTRMYLETMENILSNSDKMILDQDGKGNNIVPYLSLDSKNSEIKK